MSTVMPHPTLPKAGASTPIADYGLLADCNGSALVDRAGSIDWLCMPRYDSAAIFARLLDPDAGHWSIRPEGAFDAERRYLAGSLAIETTFTTDTGTVRLIDVMAAADGQRGHDLGFDAPHEVLRSVEAEVVSALALRERHRVDQPSRARVGRERGLDDQRAGQVPALDGERRGGADRPVAGVGVEQSREDRVAVVAGQAEPVDRAGGVHERGRVAVGQQAVVGDRRGRGGAAGHRRGGVRGQGGHAR